MTRSEYEYLIDELRSLRRRVDTLSIVVAGLAVATGLPHLLGVL